MCKHVVRISKSYIWKWFVSYFDVTNNFIKCEKDTLKFLLSDIDLYLAFLKWTELSLGGGDDP